MHNRNSRSDPEDRENGSRSPDVNSPGVSSPANGESSGSNPAPARDPDATLFDFSNSYADPDATIVDANAKFVGPTRPARATGAGVVRPQAEDPALQPGLVQGGRS